MKWRPIFRKLFFPSPEAPLEKEEETIALPQERAMRSIYRLLDLPVKEIMTQRADIKWIDLNKPFAKTLSEIAKAPHRYYPASHGDLDKIQGRLDVVKHLTLLEKGSLPDLSKALSPLLSVAPTLPCHDLLVKMKDSKIDMALVVDEFGGIDGLVTAGDLNFKIIAEMDMESQPGKKYRILKDHSIVVDGRLEMDDFEAKFGKILNAKDKDHNPETIGGLVLSIAGHVPTRGEIITHESGVQFEVLQSNARRVRKMRISHIDRLSP